jgi:hypothetical protein
MNQPPITIAAILVGVVAYLLAIYFVDRSIDPRARFTLPLRSRSAEVSVRAAFRHAAAVATVVLYFLGVRRYIDEHARAVDITKALIAVAAAGAVFYEQHRKTQRRPVSERWQRFAALTLAAASLAAYFNGFEPVHPKFYHRWEQYHYYLGAKYFHEMGYDGLYRCTLIAEDELGVVVNEDLGIGPPARFDMHREVHHPEKKIRNLGGDNLLMPAADALEHPEACKRGFSPERWEAYKADVQFFRIASEKSTTYWEDMQKDHGFNPPPVWTILGRFFAELHPASTGYLQLLASLDLLYLAGTFAALWWAFGVRVSAVAAIFFGCQAPAPYYWTGGAFLRQDWLFYLVLAACLARKRWFKLAGAAIVYSALLRIFPGLAVIGWLVVAGAHLMKHRRLAPHHRQLLAGGTIAAAVLLPLSFVATGMGTFAELGESPKAALAAGVESYRQFYEHTLKVHDRTPLTNHMGLRVLVAHNLGSGPESGRMKYVRDLKAVDPFEVWKRMRNERYDRYRPVAYAAVALALLAFARVARRIKSTWIALCLGQIFIILLSQLTCYYYTFLLLCAPLTRAKRGIEAPLFGFAALSQLVWIALYWNDDKYTALTLISLVFTAGLVCAFARKSAFGFSFGRRRAPAPASIATAPLTADDAGEDDEE